MKRPNALKSGEIRVIKIDKAAIKEFLWESIMEHGESFFDLPAGDEESLFSMTFDDSNGTMTLVAHRLADNDKVDVNDIAQTEMCTTKSMYVETPYVVRKL